MCCDPAENLFTPHPKAATVILRTTALEASYQLQKCLISSCFQLHNKRSFEIGNVFVRGYNLKPTVVNGKHPLISGTLDLGIYSITWCLLSKFSNNKI